jgi:NAD(P)-dependent dehydrogenase (short-subunit alcohol dehydrogenase family)
MQESLAGKVIIVTGAASGIGRACAHELSAAGSRVVLVDVNAEGLEAVRAELPGGTDALALALSVRSETDMARMAEETLARHGRIDALVACAGILRRGQTLKTVGDTPLDEWEAIIDINLTGTFLSNRAVLPAMMAQKEGDIINLSSTSGRQGRPFDGPYSASKFGIIGLSESLAEEVSRHGIRVQTILPDAVETPLWNQNGPAALKPPQAIPAARVAELVRYMLALPRDTYLLNPVIAPFKSRRKRGGGGGESA